MAARQSAMNAAQLSLKITERCTMKLTVVAIPWAITNAMIWTDNRLRPCAVSSVNKTLNTPTCSAKVNAYKITTATNRRVDGEALNVQRRLIR